MKRIAVLLLFATAQLVQASVFAVCLVRERTFVYHLDGIREETEREVVWCHFWDIGSEFQVGHILTHGGGDLSGGECESTPKNNSRQSFRLLGAVQIVDGIGNHIGSIGFDYDDDQRLSIPVELFSAKGSEGMIELFKIDDAQLGGNGDGWISEADRLWRSVLVWRDHNGNRFPDDGEFESPSTLGVSGIKLSSQLKTNGLLSLSLIGEGPFETALVASH